MSWPPSDGPLVGKQVGSETGEEMDELGSAEGDDRHGKTDHPRREDEAFEVDFASLVSHLAERAGRPPTPIGGFRH
jgi:hypothetical protein